ncbi:hypothetical protein S83_005416 [Arachis hypogaea]
MGLKGKRSWRNCGRKRIFDESLSLWKSSQVSMLLSGGDAGDEEAPKSVVYTFETASDTVTFGFSTFPDLLYQSNRSIVESLFLHPSRLKRDKDNTTERPQKRYHIVRSKKGVEEERGGEG